MMDKIKTFFILSEEDKKQLKKKYFQVTPNVCFCDGAVVMLKSDGTISVSGNSKFNIRKWTNITKICSGSHHIVGLKSDGRVVAFGDNNCHQCDVLSWKNVQNIFAKDTLTVGITKDDEMLITGLSDAYSDEMKLIEKNEVKLSNFMKKTERDIKSLAKQIDEHYTVAQRMTAKLNDVTKKIEDDIAKLSKQVNEQNVSQDKFKNSLSEIRKNADLLQKDVALHNKNIEDLRNGITETEKKANILSAENTESNNTSEMKTEKEFVSNFEQEIKQYDTKAIQSYVPSNDFWQQLQKVCKKFVDDASADKYMSKSLIKKFGLKKEEVFLAYDPYFDIAVFLQGKYGFLVSRSGVLTTHDNKILLSSFLEIALAKEILYKNQGTCCIFADDKLIVNFYADVSKQDEIQYLVNNIQKIVREDLLKYLAINAVETAENLEQLLDVKEQVEFNYDLKREYVKKLKKRMNDMDISKSLCYCCMKENNGEQICPYCGFDKNTEQTVPYLALGTKLKNGNYIVGRKISTDNEGAKYMAYSINDKSPVIICEFMPAGISGRSRKSNMVVVKSGFESHYQQLHDEFFRYYSQLKKLNNLYPIEHVIDVFDENNNSYAVEEAYEEIYESIPLTKYVEQGGGSLEWQWHKAITLFMPLLDTLSSIHEAKIGHYAIAPSNIVVTNDGKLKLKNFGIKETRRTGDFTEPNIIDGCAAPEQYQNDGVLDESTDVYGFTATLFYALTGNLPKSADLRKTDRGLAMPTAVFKKLPQYIVNALFKGLSFSKSERIHTFEELRIYLSSFPKIDSLDVNKTKLFEYILYGAGDDEVCLLTNCHDNSSEIVVPSEIQNKAVKALSKTFQNCKNLKMVVIPDSVDFIGEKTFYGCRVLRDVYIPHSVMFIADDAFGHCDMRLTIHGAKGSYAESYAKLKHLKFIEMI